MSWTYCTNIISSAENVAYILVFIFFYYVLEKTSYVFGKIFLNPSAGYLGQHPNSQFYPVCCFYKILEYSDDDDEGLCQIHSV